MNKQIRELFWFVLFALSFLAPWTFVMGTAVKIQTRHTGNLQFLDGGMYVSVLMIVWLAYRMTINMIHREFPR